MTRLLSLIPDLLLVLGLVAVAVGAGLVFLPAGFIVGGIELAAVGVRLDAAHLAEGDA